MLGRIDTLQQAAPWHATGRRCTPGKEPAVSSQDGAEEAAKTDRSNIKTIHIAKCERQERFSSSSQGGSIDRRVLTTFLSKGPSFAMGCNGVLPPNQNLSRPCQLRL